MTAYVCRYPDGAAGAGLLLLRACQAGVMAGLVALPPWAWLDLRAVHGVAALLAVCLVAGFATRTMAVALGLVVAITLPMAGQVGLFVGHLGACAALALLGAGAFSIDARRYGRRVIHLHAPPPDRGAPD